MLSSKFSLEYKESEHHAGDDDVRTSAMERNLGSSCQGRLQFIDGIIGAGSNFSPSQIKHRQDSVIFMSAEFVESGYAPPILEEDPEADEDEDVESLQQTSANDVSNHSLSCWGRQILMLSDSHHTLKGLVCKRPVSTCSVTKTLSTHSTTRMTRGDYSITGSITESGCYVASTSFAEKRRLKIVMQKNSLARRLSCKRKVGDKVEVVSLKEAAQEIVKNEEDWKSLRKVLRDSNVVTNEAVRAIAAPILYKKAIEIRDRRVRHAEELAEKKRSVLSSLVWRYLPR